MTGLPAASVLVRTWFGDDRGWAALLAEIATPSEDGFLADVVPVDDAAFAGLTAEGLRARQPRGAFVPAELWSVENNINLCNMDWVEFTEDLGADKVFRGF